jgi:multidrug efflux pump subunit AcrB
VDVLRQLGAELRAAMHQVPGVLYTRASIEGGQPKLILQANEQTARLTGLSLSDVIGQLQSGLEGALGGSVLESLEELPVRVRHEEVQREDLVRLSSLALVAPEATAASGWVPLTALGHFALQSVLAGIDRLDGVRVNEVLGFTAAGVLAIDATREILRLLDDQSFQLPAGYRLTVAGDSEEEGRAVGQLSTYIPVLAVLMISALVLSFRSVGLAALVALVALLSAGMGFLALKVAGYPLGFNPLIGTAGLVGVAINGAIVVLAAIRADTHARTGDPVAVTGAVLHSTRHVVATSLTTAGGFAPLLLFTGGDFWPPLAVVLAGGVLFSVPLALVFTPAVYCLARTSAVNASVEHSVTECPTARA